MAIENLKDLKKFLQLCRQQGVESIKFDGVEVYLGQQPTNSKPNRKVAAKSIVSAAPTLPGVITEDTYIDTPDALTDEQKLFWSATDNQQQSQVIFESK